MYVYVCISNHKRFVEFWDCHSPFFDTKGFWVRVCMCMYECSYSVVGLALHCSGLICHFFFDTSFWNQSGGGFAPSFSLPALVATAGLGRDRRGEGDWPPAMTSSK
mmetsp:Transcript_40111/g.65040  ORF Transcript_40111/g.65040 Transcript_40111/m.65040 type:complete len:106 (+) Transcript_40111:266-583(+)